MGQGKHSDIHITPSQFVLESNADFREYYDIGKKLGGGNLLSCYPNIPIGAYGEVYVCVHKTSHLTRAVKVMDKTTIEEAEKERFLSEIRILKIMDHPNIVKLYEVYQDRKRYYLVTE